MYPFNFISVRRSINWQEIFVAMPSAVQCKPIFDDLIVPAVNIANEKLGFTHEREILSPYVAVDDIRTQSGWINVLEHLTTARIVLGVLDMSNANVLYELGIAHATQPIHRQILIAHEEHKPVFDTKDLIFAKYGTPVESRHVEQLAEKIVDAVKWQKLEHERRLIQTRMGVNPTGLAVIMTYSRTPHFPFRLADSFKDEYRKVHGRDSAEDHLSGIANLIEIGMLGLNTRALRTEGIPIATGQEFSYWWTELGNEVLRLMELISEEEFTERMRAVPQYFW